MDNHIAPKQAAKILGATTKTIQRWDKTRKIRCIRTPGGRRRIPISEIHKILGITQKRKTIGYARVSSHTQKDDLQRQIEAIKDYAERVLRSIDNARGSPQSIAAALVYLASRRLNLGLTSKDIEEASNVSRYTILRMYRYPR